MVRPDDEARLEASKMSFGEHLEELRRALFKSIAALFVGFLVGLWFATDIVSYIQTPVISSLTQFYLNQSEAKQRARIEESGDEGNEVSEERIVTAKELQGEGLMLTEFLVSPEDLAALLKQHFTELPLPTAPTSSTVALERDRLVTLHLYQPIEDDPRLRLVGHNNMEPFAVYIRAALVSGLVFASPFIFYFIWEFVAAGLYRQEQSYVYTYLPFSLGLFVGGAILAFFYAFEPLLKFMFWYYEEMEIQPDLRLSEWISFVLLMPVAFGISFQLPLIMLLLERIGVFTVETYWRKWRAAVVVIAVIAMLLTPSADPYSMLLMGMPLVLLYFGGIWLCKFMPGRSKRRAV